MAGRLSSLLSSFFFLSFASGLLQMPSFRFETKLLLLSDSAMESENGDYEELHGIVNGGWLLIRWTPSSEIPTSNGDSNCDTGAGESDGTSPFTIE
uniref:Uncharacterized protein n=1 Tax=Lactuca sativa TaxID=4236 RepID=A0A9R1WVL3_LACSA|nr:hypothetical protein LSAT_V11C800443210 [Lactuca sativa]